MIPSYLMNRPFLPIATQHLTLRPLEEKDGIPLAALANDARIAERLARLPHPYSLEDAHKYIASSQEGLRKGDFLNLAIIRRSDQRFMGVIGLEECLGYWLGFEFWGQGYGKEAMKAFVHFAFFVLNHEALRASAQETNIPSRRIFEGLGFVQAGTKESTSIAYEGTKPAYLYTLSRKDFIDQYHAHERPIVWAVAAALINDKGELLMAERPEGKTMAGVWELPGGKIESKETLERALIRELKEELQIEVEEEDLEPITFASHRYDSFHLVMPFYLCRRWTNKPHGAEGQKLAWIKYQDLTHIPTPSADILLVHRLADLLRERGIWS